MRATLWCPLHTPHVRMVPLYSYDALMCPTCGNVNTSESLYKKWGGLFRARRWH